MYLIGAHKQHQVGALLVRLWNWTVALLPGFTRSAGHNRSPFTVGGIGRTGGRTKEKRPRLRGGEGLRLADASFLSTRALLCSSLSLHTSMSPRNSENLTKERKQESA